MNTKTVFTEYIGLVAITLVYFLMSSTNMKNFLLIAIIELPITLVYILLKKLYTQHNKSKFAG